MIGNDSGFCATFYEMVTKSFAYSAYFHGLPVWMGPATSKMGAEIAIIYPERGLEAGLAGPTWNSGFGRKGA
jgi:hypothetical protein